MQTELIELGRKLGELGLDTKTAMDVLAVVVDAAETVAEEKYQSRLALDQLQTQANAASQLRRRWRPRKAVTMPTRPPRGPDKAPRKRKAAAGNGDAEAGRTSPDA